VTLDPHDRDRLTHSCVRSAMVMIAWELDQLMGTPELRRWCSSATIELLQRTMEDKKAMRINRKVVMFSRRVAETTSAMTWLHSETIHA